MLTSSQIRGSQVFSPIPRSPYSVAGFRCCAEVFNIISLDYSCLCCLCFGCHRKSFKLILPSGLGLATRSGKAPAGRNRPFPFGISQTPRAWDPGPALHKGWTRDHGLLPGGESRDVCRLLSLSPNQLFSHPFASVARSPFLGTEDKLPGQRREGAWRGGPGWGSLRGRTAEPGRRPPRSPGRLGLSASGSGCGDLPRALGTRCSRLRSSSGRGVAPRRVRAVGEAGGAGPGGSPRSE